jgi:hypothetical protein
MATVFRLPLRTVASNISPCIPPLASVRAALIAAEAKLRSSLLFASSVGSISVDHWPLGGSLETVFKASLRVGPSINASNTNNAAISSLKTSDHRVKRRAMLENREAWSRKGLLNMFSKYTPPREGYAICIEVESRERLPVAAVTEGVRNQEAVAVANVNRSSEDMVVAAAVSIDDNPSSDDVVEATATTSDLPESDAAEAMATTAPTVEDVPISSPTTSSLMAAGRVVKCTDTWLVRCAVAPTPELRDLALSDSLKPLDLLQVVSVAARVSSIEERSNGTDSPDTVTSHRTPQGSLFVGADSAIPTGLPFHIDGPFFSP